MGALTWFVCAAMNLLPVGTPAPPLRAYSESGKLWAESLAGDVTVVDFFASWCKPCRESMKEYARVFAQHPARLIVVIVDQDPNAARAYFATHAVPPGTGFLFDPSGTNRRSWGATGVPSLYVLDRAGVVRGSRSGWGQSITDWLGEMIDTLRAESEPGSTGKPGSPKEVTVLRRGGPRQGRARSARPTPTPAASSLTDDERARRMGVEVIR